MLQDRDRRLLQDDLPFAPVAPPPAMDVSWAERLMEASTRWRRPLTLVFGGLIAIAAFFAYQSQRTTGDEVAQEVAGSGDGVAAMVDGIEPGAAGSTVTTVAVAGSGTSRAGSSAGNTAAGPTTITTTSSSGASSTTSRKVTSTTRSGATTSRKAGTTATSAAAGGSSSTGADSSSSTAAPTTTAPSSTASTAPSTQATTVTTQPTTTTAPKAVFIGDRVSFDDWDGPAAKGIAVTLWSDTNRDGREESVRATATSSDTGAYGFTVEPGCYVVTFTVPPGQSVVKGDQRKALCLGSGQDDGRIDLVIGRPVVPAPTSCVVYVGRFNGAVEVRDSAGTFTSSYGFFDAGGKLVASTSTLGPADSSGRTSRTWRSSSGFEESNVTSVAGEDGRGNSSGRVTCTRQNVF